VTFADRRSERIRLGQIVVRPGRNRWAPCCTREPPVLLQHPDDIPQTCLEIGQVADGEVRHDDIEDGICERQPRRQPSN
jgi:hypothetical protein